MQPQGLGGSVGCLFLPSLESAPKLAAACTEQTPDLLSWTFLGKASHLPPPPATADLLEPGLSLQDVLLHLVSICLHAGDEHGQLVCGGPERGTAKLSPGLPQAWFFPPVPTGALRKEPELWPRAQTHIRGHCLARPEMVCSEW